jgi:Ca2+/Na+ antiporter
MGYESLSTVVVLVIVAIIIVVWLPVRTANGMKRVDEHRQDRYSPSLHIVDAENGRRFGDIKPHKAKGAAMPASTPSARLTSEHIAHVRELRRAAIRRRQILAVCLLAITVLVFAVSFPLHFSPLLALIPFVLLLLVLVLGANASRQARQWERKVVRYERAHSGTGWSKKPSAESKDSKRVNKAEPVAAVTAPAEKPAEQIEDAATEVMEQRQIRRALRDAEIEQAKAKALRQSAAAYQAAEEHAKQSEKSDIAQSAADKPAAEPSAMVDESADRKSAAETSESSATPDASVRTDKSIESDKSVAPRVEPSLTVRDERDAAAAAADATSELVSVRPARALDVFDMSTSQDLISFTLGGEHNADNAPESLEIKSTRQVSKAEPVEPAVAEKLIDEARAVKAADDAKAADAGKAVSAGNAVDTESEQRDDADTNAATDADDEAANAAQRAAFHESEERADVEAPAATTDSLGAGLDSILARRGN